MRFLTLIVASLVISLNAMANVPFPGGVLYIQSDAAANGGCRYDGVRDYPERSIQYWYDGKALWQIKIRGRSVQIHSMPVPENAGLGLMFLDEVANKNEDRPYACIGQIEFDPKSSRDRQKALARGRKYVGKLIKRESVWYWAR